MPAKISRERHHLTPSFMMRGHFDERLIGHAQRRRQNARLVVTFIIPRWQQQQQQPQSRLLAVEIVLRRRRRLRRHAQSFWIASPSYKQYIVTERHTIVFALQKKAG